MFSALKKLARSNDDRCPAPMPMSSSLQKKFSKGVHFNMKILIKGDRNVGKSCLLQRLQGGPFTEEYVPTEQIQVAPIHWTYKNTDYIVKVEVWEVVDKGRAKKKPSLGLKLENQTTPAVQDDDHETPVLDATFLDVYKNASGVILMLDITKPWTFEYVVKELACVPADLPVVVLGNHCDMQHHRQVHSHHIDQALHNAKLTRSAPIRYAESSMRNGFGLRLLHKFLNIPFLRLQKTSLLEQLQRNQSDMKDTERELDDFQNSDEAHYNVFLDRLANKRRQSNEQVENRVISDRSPSIVLGAGKPIVPPSVNPLLAQSLNPKGIKAHHSMQQAVPKNQSQYVSPDLLKHQQPVSLEMTPSRQSQQNSGPGTPAGINMSASSGALEEFYAGALDSSFLEDLTPLSNANHEVMYEAERYSDDEITMNPKVTVDEDDLDVENSSPTNASLKTKLHSEYSAVGNEEPDLEKMFRNQTIIDKDMTEEGNKTNILNQESELQLPLNSDFPIWAGDSSYRRSPEGGEDPDISKESDPKVEKKHKKKKSKDKDKTETSEKSERREKKNKHKKSKSEKRNPNPQHDLLAATVTAEFDYEDYDSI